MDGASLLSERDRLHKQLMKRPADQTSSINHFEHEREKLEGFLQRQRDTRREAQGRLGSMSALHRARNRQEVKRLEQRIEGAQRAGQRLSDSLKQLRTEQHESIKAQEVRQSWVEERAPLVERWLHIENELGRRDMALLRERGNELPKYLENAVGPAPARPSERKEWGQAVLTIESYREKYGIKDRNKALGGEPRNTDQRLDRQQAERTVEEVNDRRLGRTRERDAGLERSLELS